uniref:UDP-glucose 6-dehydrogenase n=1 Tax=viral metagenome TaxID=1070528 RepID=A0A6C0BLB4_9ZZZZ
MTSPHWTKTIISIGAGYVGTPTMAVCAEHCPEYRFICVDQNPQLIQQWMSEHLPIYEPGLDEVIHQVRDRNLFFTTDAETAIQQADVIFISVCTPTKTCGLGANRACDLSYFEKAAEQIRDISHKSVIVVEKSTVPIGTGSHLLSILNHNRNGIIYDVVSNPEFLAEGTAINDLEHPHRVLIGCNPSSRQQFAIETVKEIYQHWVPLEKIVTTDRWSSELSKLVANAFLAQRVSSINSISLLCEKAGGNIVDISKILGMDDRIGSRFLNSSVGFGGSCFQKDVLDLIYLCGYYHLRDVAHYWEGVLTINEAQKKHFAHKVIHTLYDSVKGRHLTIFGYSFKKDTGDTRETPARTVCQLLLEEGAILHIYDPRVPVAVIERELGHVQITDDPYSACQGTEAILIVTAWDEFRTLDYQKIYRAMGQLVPVIFDGCHLIDPSLLEPMGFRVWILGQHLK